MGRSPYNPFNDEPGVDSADDSQDTEWLAHLEQQDAERRARAAVDAGKGFEEDSPPIDHIVEQASLPESPPRRPKQTGSCSATEDDGVKSDEPLPKRRRTAITVEEADLNVPLPYADDEHGVYSGLEDSQESKGSSRSTSRRLTRTTRL